MKKRAPAAAWNSAQHAQQSARDNILLAVVLAAGPDGITSAALAAHFGRSTDSVISQLWRLRDAKLVECGCSANHDWRWGRPGIKSRMAEASAERRRLKGLAQKKASRELRAARKRGEKTAATPNALRKRIARNAEIAALDAALDAWACESIRRIVPATEAEPIRPARPMSIFCMGEAA